ncbi:sugar phosphate isomerase/epimerase [Priestia koreensis]|uniref:sugar phosphate isomerase/epimerase n=1 Tax=Priestia koreensis TaxID=284581 RepID=UPI003457892F
MNMISIKSLWEMEGTLEKNFKRIYESGYSGVECPLPHKEHESLFKELLQQYGFHYIAQIFADDLPTFENEMFKATSYHPLLINSQSAKDDMNELEQLAFFKGALQIETDIEIPVAHETHRGRAMYSPWTTERLLKEFDHLKITADFSHWVCVCESLLENQSDRLDLAISRTIHIHTRAGHRQGPQIGDPRSTIYQEELTTHLNWWKKIYQHHAKRNTDLLTFTPEYGPPGYMQTDPMTGQPVSDLWDICLWAKKHVYDHITGSN